MKLKYFIPSFIAVVAMLAGCADDDSITLLDEVQVTSSYVAIPKTGGANTITVTAKDEWSINTEAEDFPSWLTVSPANGTAGATEVTFSAEETQNGRNATVYLTCAGKTQTINVIQGLATVEPATVAEVMAGPESKTYQVTGTVTSITNTSYGNLYINDGTSDTDLYIYGLFNANGQYPSAATGGWSSFGISVGDEITVVGAKVVYSGTVEFKDATLVSVQKSLISVDALTMFNLNSEEVASIPSDGGFAQAAITCTSGSAVEIEIPEDAQSWLSTAFGGVSATSVMLKATANTGAARSAVVTVKTTADDKTYTAEFTVVQEGLSGTKEVPFTVEEAIAYCSKLSGESAADVYIKGKVSKVVYDYSAKYGTGTFWISDDGAYNGAENGKSTTDTAHDFEVYSAYWFDNQPWTEGSKQLSVGDEVVICGKVTLYNGMSETSSKKAYVYSVNGVTSEANGLGSEAYPFNVAGAIAAANAGTANNVYISGTVSKVVYEFSANYGTGTFWLSDDGQFNGAENGKSTTDTAHDFEVYSAYWYNNQPWQEGDGQVAVGDDVLVYGAVTVYNGMAETSSKKAYVVSKSEKTN
jgi:hypothetical protein